MTRIRIENVVASTSLGGELDLPSIALALPGAEYEPTQFPGLIYRMMEPKTAILLFHSGKVVCTGGKSWKQVDDSVRTVAELVRKQGQKTIRHPKIEVQNIVATSDLGSEINLNTIAITLGLDHVEYEPEQFPGLVCRLEDPRVVVLLFGSGKLVCTGPADPGTSNAPSRASRRLSGARASWARSGPGRVRKRSRLPRDPGRLPRRPRLPPRVPPCRRKVSRLPPI